MARILIVDDDASIRQILRITFEAEGHEMLLAEDGSRGVAFAQRRRPDAIILDLMMPIYDGTSALTALVGDERTRAIPVLVLTAMATQQARRDVATLGATAFMTKPFDPEALVFEVEALIASAVARGDGKAGSGVGTLPSWPTS